jgi:SulP family sulfate permease
VAVSVASGLVAAFSLPSTRWDSRFGELPSGLPAPALPELSFDRIAELLPSALVIAFLAGVESLLSAMVAGPDDRRAAPPECELTAQGAANVASAAFSAALPATGAIARTATNVQRRRRTPVAGIVHAVSS